MKRRLFTILSMLSLLLFVAVVTLWLRNRWFDEFARCATGRRSFVLRSFDGACQLTFIRDAVDLKQGFAAESLSVVEHGIDLRTLKRVNPLRPGEWSFAGFRREWSGPHPRFGENVSYTIPYWFLAATTGVAPAVTSRRLLASRTRARRGHCPSCGYDLRATPERCPECGMVFAEASSSART